MSAPLTTLLQWCKSLVTTGGSLNPAALLMYGFVGYHFYGEVKEYFADKEVVRKVEVIQEASKEQIKVINNARIEQEKSNQSAGTDGWHDWANRLQDGDG